MSNILGSSSDTIISIFMCGDVMTGRGIDQILPHPVDPCIHEPFVRDARGYVQLAEDVHGPVPRPVEFDYIWGETLDVFERLMPDVKLINLETSVTTCDSYWRGKGINYRMHPANFPAIMAAGIDVCALANNHVLDWGYQGLEDTLRTLEEAGVKGAGAGRNLASAASPATVAVADKGRVHVFSLGDPSSGIPAEWAAGDSKPGVNLLADLTWKTVQIIGERVRKVKKPGDLVIASIHWEGNWGLDIPDEQITFAHRLIEDAGIDIIHGHSSHHVKGIEIYKGKPIIYGCGDFLNDYEGISGKEIYRGDLGLMYFAYMNVTDGRLRELRLIPTQVRKFRIGKASVADVRWLRDTLDREGEKFGTRVEEAEDRAMILRWGQAA